MKVILKFIGLPVKGDMEIECCCDYTVEDLINKAVKLNPNIPNNVNLMFKAKKLDFGKTLKELQITNNSKINITKSFTNNNKDNNDLSKSTNNSYNNNQDHELIIISKNKQEAINKLLSMGYSADLVNTVISSTSNEYLSKNSDIIVEKSLILLKSIIKNQVQKDFVIEQYELVHEINALNDIKAAYYSLGNGKDGQLGIDEFIVTNKFMRINNFSCSKTIKSKNNNEELINNNNSITRNLQTKINIKTISCGGTVSLALDYNGFLYSWGKYYYPYAINITTNKNEYKVGSNPTPKLVESLTNETVISIGTGENHYLAVNDIGEVFTWGEGLYGQLGHGRLDNEYYPKKIDNDLCNIKISKVLGGLMHSLAVSDKGYIFGWGSNEKFQLNFSNTKFVVKPFLLPIYSIFGSYTIKQINQLKSNVSDTDINTNEYSNKMCDFSNDIDDLIKSKYVSCGNWFTVIVPNDDSNNVLIVGNNSNKVIRITYFYDNNIQIYGIKSSGHIICVLCNKSVYIINVNNSTTYIKPILHDFLNNLDINSEENSIYVSNNYVIVKDKFNNVIMYNNFNNKNAINLSYYLPNDIDYISVGSNHLIVKTNSMFSSLGRYRYNELKNNQIYTNINSMDCSDNNKYYLNKHLNDCNLFGIDFNIKSTVSNKIVKCHTFIINRIIDLDNNTNYILVNLNYNETLLLLELLYTNNLNSIFCDYINLNSLNLSVINNNLEAIKKYLISVNKGNTSLNKKRNLKYIELLNAYIEKLNFIKEHYFMLNDNEDAYIKTKLSYTYEQLTLIDNNKKSKYIIFEDNSSNINIDEFVSNENSLINDDNINNSTNYFDKFKTKGKIVQLFNDNDNIIDTNELIINNIKQLIKKQKNFTDKRYKINYNIINLIDDLEDDLNSNIKELFELHKTHSKFKKVQNITLLYKDNKYVINSCFIEYFSKLIPTLINKKYSKNEDDIIFNLNDKAYFESLELIKDIKVKDEIINNILLIITNYINLKKTYITFYEAVYSLELVEYLKLDSLKCIIEEILEKYVNYENIYTLLEVAKDYKLIYLKHRLIVFICLNFNNAKNQIDLRSLDIQTKDEIKLFKSVNFITNI